MNIAVRKLALLEKTINEREEVAKEKGYTTNVIDSDLKERVSLLVKKLSIV